MGYLEDREGVQYHGDIMSIMGCLVPWGSKSFVI